MAMTILYPVFGVISIADCYSDASAASKLYAAGLVAYNYGSVSNCYAKGNVSSNYYGAGVVGYNDGGKASIGGCVAGNPKIDVSDKSGWSIRVLGGFKNGAKQPAENNYALKSMILSVNGVTKKVSDNILGGYAKEEPTLEQQTTYTALGWDFNKVWYIDEGKDWPKLLMKEAGLVENILLSPEAITLEVGETKQITANVYPSDAIDKTLYWTSSDEKVAKVNNGLVTAIGIGKATITASSTDGSGKTASVEAIVSAATGIDSIHSENRKERKIYYDIQGRRVNNPAKGLYISNGRKVIIK